ncbi:MULTISPECIES: DUF2971 domain-containing protein [Pantoea]|uniref:DUF2971 domain-containing protein n=1 Tax=Pantoea TaxID=53335 RepID=UPI002893698D|nr:MULTISPECIES: DUF2971 domain-containing protein [Pantoea]
MKNENLTLSPTLEPEIKLWRYMSLDKFIDILATRELFFTPLAFYSKTDPFEGLIPKVAMDAIAGVIQKSAEMIKSVSSQTTQFINERKAAGILIDPAVLERHKDLLQKEEQHMPLMEKTYFKIMQSVTVNCWHMNEFESEGMWRLYSDTNKGVAIQTNVSRLLNSISTEEHMLVSEVKYLDFHDQNLKPADCVHNGHLVPFLKRKAFAHENEVRLAITPEFDLERIDSFTPQGIRISIDPLKLIEKVYISPYASQPYPNSVTSIAEKFGIDEDKIIKSKLLTVDDSLTKLF